jgi:hypothetical protein
MEARLGSTWKPTCSLLLVTTVWEEAVWVVEVVETVANTEVDVEAEAVTPTLNVTEAEAN